MHASQIAKRKEHAEERKRKAIATRFPALVEQLQENGYRQAPPSDSQLPTAAGEKIRPEIDTREEARSLFSAQDSRQGAVSCSMLSCADPCHATGIFDKGLRGKNPATRKACAQALADMFLCADDFSERWIALFTLAKANDHYVPEATDELRELFGIDPSRKGAQRGNAFWKMKELLSRPELGASVGSAVVALLKTGYIRAGVSLFAAGIVAGAMDKLITRLSRKRLDTEYLFSLACEVMDKPEAKAI